MTIEEDLDFIKEIRDEVQEGMDRNDPERLKYAIKMLSDWIDEIEGS